MNLVSKLMRVYFDYAYNPIYDFTTAQLNRYRKLQKRCVDKLELRDNDRVLCVGVGTGNEIFQILEMNRNVEIVSVDYSRTALKKTRQKALSLGKKIESFVMDARNLEFVAGSFDKVLCIHVMDFIEENEKVADEILRVLKAGGKFVITYPSDKEGPRLGVNLLIDAFRNDMSSRKHRVLAILELLARMLVSFVYLPLLFRPNRKSYSRSELKGFISQSNTVYIQIEEDSVYQDFIVYGRKSSDGGKQNAS